MIIYLRNQIEDNTLVLRENFCKIVFHTARRLGSQLYQRVCISIRAVTAGIVVL